jgi:multidrug transporter EmrE-like cation transporter
MGFTDIVIVAAVEIFGDFQLRWYAQTNLMKHLVQGILGYIGVVVFLIRSFRTDNVLYVNSLWDGLSGLIESVAAYYYLGDRLKSNRQYVGLLMTIAGVILLKTG